MLLIREAFDQIADISFDREEKPRRLGSARGVRRNRNDLDNDRRMRAGRCREFDSHGCGLGTERGAVLLEVILALALFVLAATIITGGLSSSINEVKRLHLNAHASNLAVSVLSEMQMGIQAGEASGPNAFDPPFEQWKWQTVIGPVNEMVGATNPIQKVEVIIRHETEPVVYRLTQFLPVVANGPSLTTANATPPLGGGSVGADGAVTLSRQDAGVPGGAPAFCRLSAWVGGS